MTIKTTLEDLCCTWGTSSQFQLKLKSVRIKRMLCPALVGIERLMSHLILRNEFRKAPRHEMHSMNLHDFKETAEACITARDAFTT
ncbi:hypothetical protein CEXT_667731 [Caerostris extrusa]|uniref:Uncharacterized protein n=1 Tax=Caerostris extrusa TaxID=172846 RepID=A0AAV4UF14_CAEEX|nr:hypothetical protein CEXT_667731 [Caerostris extrusa]